MQLTILKNLYSIYRLQKESPVPAWINSSDFFSVTRTKDELSVVALKDAFPPGSTGNIIMSKDWRIIKIEGPLDLSLIGIIAELSAILKNNNIPIFTISTFDTDYILVRQKDLEESIKALNVNGHQVLMEE